MTTEWTKYDVNAGRDGNLGAKLRVAPDESEGGIAVVEHTLPPKKLAAPLHRHTHEDEISYIIEGRMGIQEGDEVTTVEAGDVAVKERGVWHTFWNPGTEPLRFLEVITPGEFAGYFAESAAIRPDDGQMDDEAKRELRELNERYGFELDPGSIPELIERHDLER